MIAVISDIHGNLHALEAVLNDMPRDVSNIWVLGDMVGGLPYPCEVLDCLINLHVPVTAVLGNWEVDLIAAKKGLRPEYWERLQFGTAAWTVDTLKHHHWEFLEGLAEKQTKGDVPGRALLYHSNPEGTYAPIPDWKTAAEEAAKHTEKWLLGGHTHVSRVFCVNEQRVVVAGSVGLSLDNIGGMACYALLDGSSISFRHVPYDIDAALEAFMVSEAFERGPYYSRAIMATLLTGRAHFGGLDDFISKYVQEKLGYVPEIIPKELWNEAADNWKLEDWIEEKIKAK